MIDLSFKLDRPTLMQLEEFIQQFNKKGNVILLEGKRKVLPEDEAKLVAIGRLLARSMPDVIFRSGNASGADELFAQGVMDVAPDRFEVIAPYSGHRDKGQGYRRFNLDEIDLAKEPELVYQSRQRKSTEKLIDRYASGKRDRVGMKGAYLIRDTAKVIGTSNIPPASVGLFYDDLKNPRAGGTGHTMDVCEANRVKLLDQQIWMNWI